MKVKEHSLETQYRKYFVQFLGWFDDARCLYIIMDFFEHGDLHKYMRKNGTIPETEAASITAQVAQALQYMHDEDYIHRDIKPPVRSDADHSEERY